MKSQKNTNLPLFGKDIAALQNSCLYMYIKKSNKYTEQPMGRNTIGSIPKYIANFLELPSPDSYTGHCFRRSSVTALADSGASVSILKINTDGRVIRWPNHTSINASITKKMLRDHSALQQRIMALNQLAEKTMRLCIFPTVQT